VVETEEEEEGMKKGMIELIKEDAQAGFDLVSQDDIASSREICLDIADSFPCQMMNLGSSRNEKGGNHERP